MRALLISLALISGIPWSVYFGFEYLKSKQENDPKYTILALVCKCRSPLSLPNALFSEYLGLSVDKPTNLYKFPLKKGEEHLNNLHVFKNVELKRIPPSTLLVEYELRRPLFLMAGLSNTAIDEEGVVFPYYPFFSPKKLPEIRLSSQVKWGDKVDMSEVLPILKKMKELDLPLKGLDLSHTASDSLGEREMVLKIGKSFVRLNPYDVHALEYLKKINISQDIIEARIPNQLIIKPLE